MQLLNEIYYQELITRFGGNRNQLHMPSSNFIKINTNFFDRAITRQGYNLVIQIPTAYPEKKLLYANLLFCLTELQFLQAEEEPEYEKGMILKGMNYSKPKDFELVDISEDKFCLREILKGKEKAYHSPAFVKTSYEKLRKEYVVIKKSTRKKRLENIGKLFKQLYGIDFIPNYFKSKSIVICKKSIWSSLSQINIMDDCTFNDLVPNTYFAKTGAESSAINIDPALYFVPDYYTAFNSILSKNIKIDSLVLIDAKLDRIPRILMDQKDFGFNLFAVTTKTIEDDGVQVWRWLKEEIEKINSI